MQLVGSLKSFSITIQWEFWLFGTVHVFDCYRGSELSLNRRKSLFNHSLNAPQAVES